ncbi:hypothetical protein CVM73_32015 [Bradyrhizobium forestalis]|uniref:DUF6894 domain-containing protein n=1 Tax=Bradyrhizobium forestalis TaxID=1419263 RepID=A0A2M8R0B0_9BRAD|nr:hypothetical protein [Bradyrhizobium forestalis]PJG51244.1 hypothetical protein CVM73_32015 [Bradyrhizobium forestalis]
MAQVYFHCSNRREVLMDRRGTSVSDLIQACEEATSRVRLLIGATSLEDWRDWALHVTDETGDEIFVLPFSSMLGKPN